MNKTTIKLGDWVMHPNGIIFHYEAVTLTRGTNGFIDGIKKKCS